MGVGRSTFPEGVHGAINTLDFGPARLLNRSDFDRISAFLSKDFTGLTLALWVCDQPIMEGTHCLPVGLARQGNGLIIRKCDEPRGTLS